jgi:hypothetical protein
LLKKCLKDTKVLIRRCKSKDRQHNYHNKRDKKTNNDLQNITQKTKDWAAGTPIKTGGEKWTKRKRTEWKNNDWLYMFVITLVCDKKKTVQFKQFQTFHSTMSILNTNMIYIYILLCIIMIFNTNLYDCILHWTVLLLTENEDARVSPVVHYSGVWYSNVAKTELFKVSL